MYRKVGWRLVLCVSVLYTTIFQPPLYCLKYCVCARSEWWVMIIKGRDKGWPPVCLSVCLCSLFTTYSPSLLCLCLLLRWSTLERCWPQSLWLWNDWNCPEGWIWGSDGHSECFSTSVCLCVCVLLFLLVHWSDSTWSPPWLEPLWSDLTRGSFSHAWLLSRLIAIIFSVYHRAPNFNLSRSHCNYEYKSHKI